MLESFRYGTHCLMLRVIFSLAIGALLALLGPQAMAIGFGKVGNATVLGQGLDFTVAVRLEGDEALSADCVSAEVFSGENRLPTAAVRVAIEPGADPGERTLRVRSNFVIDEPVIGVNLQLTCPNRLARKFVAFVDPPAIELARAAPPATALASLPRRSEAPNPRLAVAAPAAPEAAITPAARALAKPAQRSRRTAAAAEGRALRVVALAPGSPASAASRRSSTAAAKPARATAAAPGGRLELQATEHAATRERLDLRATAMLAAATSTATAAPEPADPAPVLAAADESAAQRARERERLLGMEDSLAKMRAESKAMQASLAQLQSSLRDAQQQRDANPLVPALAALAAVLALALGLLLWRRAVERRVAPEWWTPPAPVAAEPPVADDLPDKDRSRLERQRRLAEVEPALAETTASPMMLSEVHALAQASAEESLRGFEPAHEMSVEELMDLEQQAEFFIVLGQEEAAIDLLMGHLRSSGGASPLPYLKLLEIYRRRNEREAFERTRERFNRRFNAYAPDWETDPQQGRALLDYSAAVERLQSLWGRPAQAMQALEAALFRRDSSHATFDLPAYRELLLLYSVARDLSEREAAPAGVDLLLPLGADAPDVQPLTRLHPSAATGPPVDHAMVVDLDVASLDAGLSGHDDPPSRFHTDFSPTSGYMGLPGEQRPKAA